MLFFPFIRKRKKQLGYIYEEARVSVGLALWFKIVVGFISEGGGVSDDFFQAL